MSARVLVAVFPSVESASEAAQRLMRRGVDPERVHTQPLEATGRYTRALQPVKQTEAGPCALIGTGLGAIAGLAAGGLGGAGLISLPGSAALYPGPAIALLYMAMLGPAGALVGGAMGAYAGGRTPTPEATLMRSLIRPGAGALIVTPAGDRAELERWLSDALALGEAPAPRD